MINRYSICNSNILIDSCFKYIIKEGLNDFIVEPSIDNNDIKIVISSNDGQIDKKGQLVYDDNMCKIYKDKYMFYRESYLGSKDRISIFPYNLKDENILQCYIESCKIGEKCDIYDVFSMIGFEYLLFLNKAMILHSSFISYDGNGILFTAPSQTGKSTQADLWEKYQGAEIINGDRAGIKKEDGVFYGYGLPYAGSSKIYKNKREAIKAIIVLRQGKENKIRRLKSIEAFKYLYSEMMVNTWNEEFINGISDMIMDLISKVPIYMMECLPDESAVNLLKKELNI